jgi:hypothetical protein
VTNKRTVKGLIAAAVGAVCLAPAVAKAALVLTLTSGAATVTIADGSPQDTNPAPGRVDFDGPVGPFYTSFTTGHSNSPGAALGILQLQSLDVRNDSGARETLTITMSDNNFNPHIPTPQDVNNRLLSGVGLTMLDADQGDNVTFQSWFNPGNEPGPAFDATRTTGPQVATATGVRIQAFSSDNETSVPAVLTQFNLTQRVVINLSPAGQVNLSGTTAALTGPSPVIPEPASLTFLGIAAVGLLGRRRSR